MFQCENSDQVPTRPHKNKDPTNHGFWNPSLSWAVQPEGRIPKFMWFLLVPCIPCKSKAPLIMAASFVCMLAALMLQEPGLPDTSAFLGMQNFQKPVLQEYSVVLTEITSGSRLCLLRMLVFFFLLLLFFFFSCPRHYCCCRCCCWCCCCC